MTLGRYSRSIIASMGLSTLATIVVMMAAVAFATTSTTPSPVSTQYQPEPQHCLNAPIDHSQVYWNFGGSTVMTSKYARLTPATPGRRGWLWNEYPLESEDFEVEFKFEVFSKPHLGGDGFALWFVNAEADPAFLTNTNALTGPIFGMKSNFKGVGVLFDVYDNDHQRNNPSIFVIQNNEGNFAHSHDLDFENDMIKKTPRSTTSSEYDRYRCVVEYRNLGRPAKALVKFLNRILHVYIDTEDGQGWRFCLAVEINRMTTTAKPRNTLRDTHIAFTAATGQVSDNIDILEVTTRYLKSEDTVRDADFAQLPSSSLSGGSEMIWLLITSLALGLTAITAYDFNDYRSMMNSRIDVVTICHRLNENLYRQAYAHALLTLFLLIQGRWIIFGLNLILVLVRVAQHRQQALELNSASLTRMGTRVGGVAGMSPDSRYILALVVLGITDIFCFVRMFSDI